MLERMQAMKTTLDVTFTIQKRIVDCLAVDAEIVVRDMQREADCGAPADWLHREVERRARVLAARFSDMLMREVFQAPAPPREPDWFKDSMLDVLGAGTFIAPKVFPTRVRDDREAFVPITFRDVKIRTFGPLDGISAVDSGPAPAAKPQACPDCWGTGYHKGMGAPCRRGCKP